MKCKACGADCLIKPRKAIDSRNDIDCAATGEREDLCPKCYAVAAECYEEMLAVDAPTRNKALYHYCINDDFPKGGDWNVDSEY